MLNGKTAIITGCSRGIGKAAVDLFIKNNVSIIWACYRKKNESLEIEIKKQTAKLNIEFRPIYFDFTNDLDVEAAAKEIVKKSERIDILVNNAGIIDTSLFLLTKVSSMKELFNINFFSQLAFSQIIIKKMIRNKTGSIINISSTAATDPVKGRLAYSSAKAALETSSSILSKELSAYNIRVNSISPGLTDTDLMRDSHPKDIIEDMNKKISLGRIAEPSEIANTILFLASDLSSYITGQNIRVDGGI